MSADERRGALTRGQRFAVLVGPWIIRALAATWRIRLLNDGPWRAMHANRQPYVMSFWHGTMLPLISVHRGRGTAILVSEHRDGEVIARIIEQFGLRTLRGSTSRGAARALMALVRALESGTPIAVTPDGPRGPLHSYAPGGVIAAQRAGAPIVSIGVSASRAWRLRSWDRFMIPKPFSRVVVAYSDPEYVKSTSTRDAQAEIAQFTASLHGATTIAHKALGIAEVAS